MTIDQAGDLTGADDAAAVQRLKQMIEASASVVVFTGAGISTESGIPDFRGPNGLWTRNQPIDFRDFSASSETRRESWRRKFRTEDTFAAAKPNQGHLAIAELVRRGKAGTVITQNIDGLHQASGIAEGRIIELHGSTHHAACLDCGQRHELAPIRRAFLADETLPLCEGCGGMVKTATISFGQAMPEREVARAEAASMACDLFLAIGSSLVVYPAAGLPLLAKQNGARLVILNRTATELDLHGDLVIHGEIGPILEAAVS